MVFFFPGQGSQAVGMGQELFDKHAIAKEIYAQANEILGFDIQLLSFNGPEDQLTNTKFAQPAILVYQHILTTLLKEQNIVPTAVAGHSMGEFSALLAAEMLDFPSALKLVQKRGELMAASDPDGKGGMAAILGLDDDAVIKVCEEASKEFYVEPVNFNTPGQVVISGLKEGVAKASELALAAGAKRALPLAVSGAFHSKLMEQAAEEFANVVAQIEFKDPICRIISNVTAESYTKDQVKDLLPRQMKSPVQWVKSVQNLVSQGFKKGIEVSSGAVISGMVRKIEKEFEFEKIDTYLS
ncbi:MAG: ACP S-malonyltransferase [Brevinema sp.]